MPANSPIGFMSAMAYEVRVSCIAVTGFEDAVGYIAERFAAPRAMKLLLDACPNHATPSPLYAGHANRIESSRASILRAP